MSHTNRREFLGQIGSAAIAIPGLGGLGVEAGSTTGFQSPGAAPGGAMYDLLIAGGRVIDPTQNLSAERDVAIAGGRIARIAANIPPAQATEPGYRNGRGTDLT